MSKELVERNYNGVTIQQRADGYWNATAMCQANGKYWSHYLENKTTEEYLTCLERSLGIPRDVLVQTIITGANELRGTWVHRRVAIHLAQWCSSDFAVQVSGWVEELLTTGKVELTPVKPLTPAEALLQQVQLMVEHERRLASVENRVQQIETRHHEAEQSINALEPPDREAPEKSLRAKINELVRMYCRAKNADFRDTWNRLYKELYYRCHFDAKRRAENSGKTALDCVEEGGQLADLYAIASEILV